MPGSIRKRGNAYCLTVSHGYDECGKQNRFYKTVQAKSDAEAQKQLALFYAEVVSGKQERQTKMTLRAYVDYWRENYGSNPKFLSRKTYERYNELLNGRIIPALGHLRLDEIQPGHILRFLRELQKPGVRMDGKPGVLSDRQIEMYYRLLSAIFNKAVKWKLMPENPCASVDAPKVEYDPEDIRIYDEETLGQFLNTLETDPKVKTKYKALVYIALITGMRRGEILALEWSAIDLERCQIYVRQASEYIVGQPVTTKDPKTKGSKRKLSISNDIVYLLNLLKEEQVQQQNKKGDKWVISDRVFTNNTGGPMHVNTFHNWLQKFTAANNLPPISPHDFRHMSATYKLQEGAGLKAVQGDLGHTRVGTTNRYTHRLESAARDATNRMTAFVQRIKQTAATKDSE